MWEQNYAPVGGSLGWSALVAALPIFVLLYLLGVRRRPAWQAALTGLGAAVLVALVFYGMPVGTVVSSVGFGAAFGLFPIGWVVFCAILLYRITVETSEFEIIKDSVGHLTDDRRLHGISGAGHVIPTTCRQSGLRRPETVSWSGVGGDVPFGSTKKTRGRGGDIVFVG